MPEEAERQNLSQENKKFIEVEAPERLKTGQNLYDQEPFLSLIEGICETSGKTPNVVRTNISYYAEGHFGQTQKDPKYLLFAQIKDVDNFSPLSGAGSIHYDDRLKILDTLKVYPFWTEYIVLSKQNMRYGRNGNPVPQFEKAYDKGPPSYANWVTQKLQRQKRLWLVGIEEIFPQDVGHPAVSLPNITGIKPGNRRYTILKAAEIIK